MSAAPDSERSASAGAARLVLYIDDSAVNLKLVERMLERLPAVELMTATEGGAGLALALERRPALILLDLHLPDMDGEQVLARIRAEPAISTTPVIVLSADARPEQVEKVLSAGADEYVTKPMDLPAFLGLISRTLERGR